MVVLASKPHLSTTLLNLMQKHDFLPSAVRRVVLAYPRLFNLDDEVVKLRPQIDVCASYNERGDCNVGEQCDKLHYLKDVCVVDSCFRNHDWSFQPNARILCNLFLEELSNDVLCQMVQLVIKDRQRTAEQAGRGASVWTMNTEGDVEVPEICYASVESLCSRENAGCHRLHAPRHYHWQVQEADGAWKNLDDPQVEALERSFCDPAQEEVPLPPSVRHRLSPNPVRRGRDSWSAELESMTLRSSCGGLLPLRRLCTEEKEDVSVPAKTYLWYFQTGENDWKLYGSSGSSVGSEEIEHHFRSGSRNRSFTSDTHAYTIDFATMIQTDDHTGHRTKIRRRPRPHLDDDDEETLTSSSPTDEDDEHLLHVSHEASVPTEDFRPDIPLPDTWLNREEECPLLATLDPFTDEYREVLLLLQPLTPSRRPEKIRRIQNPRSWRTFQGRLEEMSNIYGGGRPRVRQLFHGTTRDVLPKILTHNLDCTLQGHNYGNKKRYGRGVYFFTEAERAFRYSIPDDKDRWYLLVALVAVGGVAEGSPTMEAPPTDPDTGAASDTTVDDTDAPTVLVKYHKEEYFPQYIVTLS